MAEEGPRAESTRSPETAAVEAAAAAAEATIFDRIDPDSVADLDVRITLEDGQLTVDVSLTAETTADYTEADVEAIADAAAHAAEANVDDRLS